jgi:hypothetical protein
LGEVQGPQVQEEQPDYKEATEVLLPEQVVPLQFKEAPQQLPEQVALLLFKAEQQLVRTKTVVLLPLLEVPPQEQARQVL